MLSSVTGRPLRVSYDPHVTREDAKTQAFLTQGHTAKDARTSTRFVFHAKSHIYFKYTLPFLLRTMSIHAQVKGDTERIK